MARLEAHTLCCDPQSSSTRSRSPAVRLARVRRWSNGRSAQRFRCAERIVHCGEFGGIGRRGHVAERGMRPARVVIGDPPGGGIASVVETDKQGFVEEFVAHSAIESFADPVLHRLSRRDEVPGHAGLLRPFEHVVRGELGAVVADDEPGRAAPIYETGQLSRHSAPADGRIDDGRQTFLGDWPAPPWRRPGSPEAGSGRFPGSGAAPRRRPSRPR
ncbi:hypothetical protein SAMN05444413_111105 [Roseivivax marinus]|nr:hypothetical protein SAMN05444413_111105 [Roseivivax marinus]